jgi:hypothetical protein
VALGDVNGDGTVDIITGTEAGVGGHVKAFSGLDGLEIRSFLAYPGASGGVWVACADLDGDGKDDIITGAGSGVGGHVKVFSGATGLELRNFLAYPARAAGCGWVLET